MDITGFIVIGFFALAWVIGKLRPSDDIGFGPTTKED